MLWGLATILTLVGLFLLILGIRGRRVGDTPHCRRCKFDLVGLPQTVRVEFDALPVIPRCPECGGSLATPRAITTGYRTRRLIIAFLGLLVLLIATALGGLVLSATRTTLNDIKPTWLLILEATAFDSNTREAVGAELLTRHKATPLTNEQLAALIEPALDAQADLNVDWEKSPWWQLLDVALAASLLSADQQTRYLRTAIGDLTWALPDTALADHDWLPFGSTPYPELAAPPRLVPAGPIHTALRLQTFAVNGTEHPLHPHERDFNWRAYCRQYEITLNRLGQLPQAFTTGTIAGERRSPTPVNLFPTLNLPEGEYTLTSTWHIEARMSAPPTNGVARWTHTLDNAPDTSWTFEAEHTLTAAPLEQLLQFVGSNDEGHAVPNIEIGGPLSMDDKPTPPGTIDVVPSSAWGDRVVPYQLNAMMVRDDPRPVREWVVGFLLLRANDQSWPIGYRPFKADDPLYEPSRFISAPLTGTTLASGFGTYIDELPYGLPRVDLVIMPDPLHAAQIGATGPFWNEPIIIRDIPLNWAAIRDRDPPPASN